MDLLQKGKEPVIAPSRPQDGEPTLPEYVQPMARRYVRRYLKRVASAFQGIEDFEQDLLLYVLKRLNAFDPEEPRRKAQILQAMKLRAFGLYRQALHKLKHAHASLDAILECDHEGEEPGILVAPEVQESDLPPLTPDQEKLCERAQHESIRKIAKDLQVPYWQLRRSIRKLARPLATHPSHLQPNRSGDQP